MCFLETLTSADESIRCQNAEERHRDRRENVRSVIRVLCVLCNSTVLYSRIFEGGACVAGGNKMAWRCIGLDYITSSYICMAQMLAATRVLQQGHLTRGFSLQLRRERFS